ncbi:hypothetical protein ACFXAF_26100, partial [Kitasatospora sp. NPDC059463]
DTPYIYTKNRVGSVCGSSATASQGSGTGLRGLRERLAAHDGELTLPQAAPGSFRLLASVPL